MRRRFAYVCIDPTLFSVVVWGHVEESDSAELSAILMTEQAAGVRPHRSLLHFQHLESVEELAVRRIAAFMSSHQAEQAKVVTKEAVVRPAGTIGMLVGGFYEVVEPPYPVAVCSTVAEAIAWLGADVSAETKLDEVLAAARSEAHLVQTLRDLLIKERLDARAAALRLGVSERTLQRRLREAGSSFRGELSAARLRAAQDLLLSQPGMDVKVVAIEAGFSSTQSFCHVFRRAMGVTPNEWRERLGKKG